MKKPDKEKLLEMEEAYKNFVKRYQGALVMWMQQYGEAEPPVVWDESRQDYRWINRAERRRLMKGRGLKKKKRGN